MQRQYHYVYGPYAQPVMAIWPGDIIVAEIEDAFWARSGLRMADGALIHPHGSGPT